VSNDIDRSDIGRLSRRYAFFANHEARGQSALYERLALEIASAPEVLSFIARLPVDRRQPNLFLASLRQLHGVPADIEQLVKIVRQDPDRIAALMLRRTTQTNEPARCSVLLPLLARLPQPVALLEVGASAGLCLLPDRYGYDYGAMRIEPPGLTGNSAPVFRCAISGSVPLPSRHPSIAWRKGLDLNPIDLQSREEIAWLETLVWPGQDERLRGLQAAVEIARREPPEVIRGNLLTDLEPLMAAAPKDATLVVFHTAVLAYVSSPENRERFAATMRKANAVWISNEAPSVFPSLADKVTPSSAPGRFLSMQDGEPIAWTGPHGQSLDWFGSP
jgi:hypothetical protein